MRPGYRRPVSAAVPRPDPLRNGILRTDMYQLTMAQLYVRHGLHERNVRFEHFFRSYPDYGDHRGLLRRRRPGAVRRVGDVDAREAADVEALAHRSRHGAPLFDEAFLDWFAGADFGGLRIEAVSRDALSTPTPRSPSSRARWPRASCSTRRSSTGSTSRR